MRLSLSYHTLDVFTETRFAGNPLAVVHGADSLSDAQMQTIAREFNLSETVFVMKPTRPAHSARVRIFTPAVELPFAGHPTVGTAALLAELRNGETISEQEAIVVLEEAIGTVRVGVRLKPGAAAFAEFDAPKLPEETGGLPSPERIAAALGLIPSEIGFANYKPLAASAGTAFAFVPVSTLEAMARATPSQPQFDQVFSGPVPPGAFLYCRETMHTNSSFHARLFAPRMGIVEDPATGSAAAAFAAIIRKFDAPPDGMHRWVIEQGFEMGRPSLIALSMEVARGKLEAVRIGGHAVRVSAGVIEV